MASRKQHKEEYRNVASINKDYVRSVERQEKRQKAHKVRLFRRLGFFALLVVVVMSWLTMTMFSQKNALAAKEQQKLEAKQELVDILEEQEMLKSQIVKLNDDEYIAKLARKEYFLSDEGEIIFSIPEKEDADKKNKDSKE
ncbi:septum formation initiator family protein [Paenisporosarcina quisquiliarum]|jgi:cell division protein DivIC|uniref:FtsB family cell division protein n=1 Tax=Paenisporosarcina quisquiliarum TaxID=365346 RepID=UPI0037361712